MNRRSVRIFLSVAVSAVCLFFAVKGVDWSEALQARQTQTSTETAYLLGTPLLADYLEEGVSALGLSLEDFQQG